MTRKSSERTLSIPLLSMMTLVILFGIENASTMAQIGWGSITAYFLAALLVLIPVGLVSAELASGWSRDGGVYTWIREAFGARTGFFAVIQQWVAWVFTIPTVFTFVAVSATYVFDPALKDNKAYTALVVIAITVIATGLNFFGVRKSGIISVLSVVALAVIPTAVILVLAGQSVLQGDSHATFHASDLQLFNQPGAFGWMIAGVNSFIGLEMSAYFLTRLRNPQKQFPWVLVIAGALAFGLLTLLTLAVFVTSSGSASLTAGIMETIQTLFDSHNLAILVPILAALITFGGLLKSSTVVLGPATGLYATAEYGHLPKRLARVNKHGAPVAVLVLQGLIVIAATMAFVLFQNVETTFFILLVLSVIPYMITYVLMYAAAVRLRYTQPEVKRAFRVPGGRFGIWIVALIGGAASVLVVVQGVIPNEIPAGQRSMAIILVLVVTALSCALPFLLDRHRVTGRPVIQPQASVERQAIGSPTTDPGPTQRPTATTTADESQSGEQSQRPHELV